MTESEKISSAVCYLIAEDSEKQGCYVLRTRRGPELIRLMRRLNDQVGDRIQLATITRPSAYGEYEPYTFVDNAADFEKAVLSMQLQGESINEIYKDKEHEIA